MKKIKNILYLDYSILMLLSPSLTVPDAMWITLGQKIFQVSVKDTQRSPLEEVW
jgi:hypothetical protein